MKKPFLYFVFVPAPDQRQDYLEYVVQEEKGIRYALVPLKAVDLLDYDAYSAEVDPEYLNTTLPKFHERIRVFHFSGHAGSIELAFKNSQYTIDNLASMLNDLDLDLVVLNGCSTHGFVKRLHQAGVKAVLATSERIGDKSACDFSLAFYQNLTVPQMSLRNAFEKATTILGKNATGVKVRGELGDPVNGDQLPWGLYLRNDLSETEKEEILGWKLITGQDQQAVIPESSKGLLKEFEETKNEYAQQRHLKLEEIKKDEDLLASIHLLPDSIRSDQKALAKDRINKARAWLTEKEEELANLYKKITEQALQNKHRSDRENLRQHLENINFSSQINDFSDTLINHDGEAHAFILRGSPVCGHEILLHRLLEIAEIDHENTFTRIEVCFSSQSHTTPSSTNIWSKLQVALNGLSNKYVESNDPQKIVDAILSRYYAPNHIVFVFKDVYPNADLNISIIKEFWMTFLDLFNKAKKNRKTTGGSRFRILLFVLDKHCLVNQNIHCLHDTQYQQLLSQHLPEEQQAFLLKNIRIVDFEELKEWKKKGVPLSLLQKLGDLKTFIGTPGMPVLTTIDKICKKANAEDVFNDLLYSYQIQYMPLEALHQNLSDSL